MDKPDSNPSQLQSGARGQTPETNSAAPGIMSSRKITDLTSARPSPPGTPHIGEAIVAWYAAKFPGAPAAQPAKN